MDVRVLLDGDTSHHLHGHGAVDEEDQTNQQHDPGQGLEGLGERPE